MNINHVMLPDEEEYKPNRNTRLIIILSAATLTLFALAFILLLHTYSKGLPSIYQLTNIEPSISTKIYSLDGQIIKEFYNERRILVPLNRMSPHLIDAVIATEDRKFYEHWGMNIPAFIRAMVVNLWHREFAQGASTITQQLARTLFLTREKTIPRKIKEILTAIKLERNYSKNEILEMYLNQSYFGRGAYGIQASAQTYFNKNADELSVLDCALLVGLLKAPANYSPIENPQMAQTRRNVVLDAMADARKITKQMADSLRQLPLSTSLSDSPTGKAPYFTEMVRQYLETKYGEKQLYSSGMAVYTTLNVELQKEAEKTMFEQLDILQQQMEKTHSLDDTSYTVEIKKPNPQTNHNRSNSSGLGREYKQIQGSLVVLDNNSGDILALIGGKNFDQSKFNRAIQAQRQPGSAFKPFVFTAAIDNGYKVTDIIYDTPIVLIGADGKEWRPENYDKTFSGPMNLREALRISRNLVSIKLLQKIGPKQAIFYASKMGIKSVLQAVPSLAIGTSEVNLLELTSAYSVFPNGGIKVEPRYVLKIVDRYGNILEENSSPQKEEVLNDQTAYVMTNLLQTVVDRGTGAAARWLGFTRPAGGKTGTTDECMDNWFVGFTPQITAGVWVGYDDKTVIGRDITGASTALPIWTKTMLKAHENLPVENFSPPAGIAYRTVCLESGLLATDKCPDVAQEVFVEGNEPERTCDLHPSRGTPSTDKTKSKAEKKGKEQLHF